MTDSTLYDCYAKVYGKKEADNAMNAYASFMKEWGKIYSNKDLKDSVSGVAQVTEKIDVFYSNPRAIVQSTTPLPGGRKDDTSKSDRYDLIPPEALDALARLYAKGAEKYGDHNWAKGMRWGRIFRAMIGHAFKFWKGESYDPEDGQHHLMSVAWCAFSLYVYEQRKLGTDDRTKI